MNKTIRIGIVPHDSSVFCKIKHTDGQLSISGVIGPLSNGNAHGSCGQIIMSWKEYDERGCYSLADITPAPGWTADTIKQFFDAWHAWHLNDMRAGCAHQRAAWNPSEKIEVTSYKLTSDAYHRRLKLIEMAAAATAREKLPQLTDNDRALLGLDDWYRARFNPPNADDALSGCYEVAKRETKTAGWTYPHEHPRGILTKPCDMCGYRYGSAWLKEEVPADVLAFLASLPDAGINPAWV